MTKVIRHKDASSFLSLSLKFLSENETMNNLILGLALSMRKSERELDGGELFYTLVVDNSVVGCALRSDQDRSLILTNISKENLQVLVKKLRSDDIKLLSIVAESNCAKDFVGIYGKRTKLVMNQGVYELREVVVPKNVQGILKKASIGAIDICTEFLNGFLIDCFEDSNLEKAKKMMERYLRFSDVYLWLNDENKPVSLCAKTRDGLHGVAISLVYTPPEQRGRGYASACVAYASKIYLDADFELCYLHTDLSNPTSNKIYEQIGYKKVGEMIHYEFV